MSKVFIVKRSKRQKKQSEALKDKEQGFDQKGYDAIQSKIQKQPFEVNIRVVASAQSRSKSRRNFKPFDFGFQPIFFVCNKQFGSQRSL